MDENRIVKITEGFVKSNLKTYDSGHDWWHIVRVRNTSRFINGTEKLADPFIVEITALLHDTADSKFSGDTEKSYLLIYDFMMNNGLSHFADRVINVIKNISFSSKSNVMVDDPLLHVVQDADRLDAIGAIGVARAFNYGGFRNNRIYDPDCSDGNSSTIGHFYEKLLLLKDMMKTETGRRLAFDRHEFLEVFLREFFKEWESGSGMK